MAKAFLEVARLTYGRVCRARSCATGCTHAESAGVELRGTCNIKREATGECFTGFGDRVPHCAAFDRATLRPQIPRAQRGGTLGRNVQESALQSRGNAAMAVHRTD